MAQAQLTMAAAMAGTSSSFGGGGDDQPPNTPSEMETGSPANSEDSDDDGDALTNDTDAESSRDSIYSFQPGSVTTVANMQRECLKCPVCPDYPRKEVYQCFNGHIVCNLCYARLTNCPICRVTYGRKIRNLIAEALLDTITHNCSFRAHGCWRTNIPRNQLTAHEIQCDHK